VTVDPLAALLAGAVAGEESAADAPEGGSATDGAPRPMTGRPSRNPAQSSSSDREEFATTSRLLVPIASAANSGLSSPATASGTAMAL